jgi:hypothetical protein
VKQRVLLALGVATCGLGFVLVLTPVSVSSSVAALFALLLIVAFALGVGALAAIERSVTTPDGGEVPDPAARPGVATPGDEFDAWLSSVSVAGADRDAAALADRFEALAVPVVARAEDCSTEAARERLADGTWTDDAAARAFFTGQSPSIFERVRTVLTGEPTAVRRARRVVAALDRQASGGDDD